MPAPETRSVSGRYFRKSVGLLVVTCVLVQMGCTSGASRQRSLDKAIALYIEGRYEEAEKKLARLMGDLESEEDRRTAYLYLGRTQMALGDYEAAVDAFSTGILLGWGVQFEGYLREAQRHVGMSSRMVRLEDRLTRAQLAALLYDHFVSEEGTSQTQPQEQDSHRGGYIDAVREAGFMSVLPDGDFHGERVVTPAALYFVAHRVAASLGIPYGVLEAHYYPLGYRSTIGTDGHDGFVSGEQAVELVQALSSTLGR